jgi:hypothetical protein
VVWIAEADDFADQNFLLELAPAFCESELVLAYCQSKQIDGAGNVLADSYLDYALGASDCCLTDYYRDGREEIRKAMCIKNTIPNVSAVLIRRQTLRDALAEAGKALADLRVAGDWLVYLHVLMKGKVMHSKKALNYHRRHANSVTDSLQKQKHLQEVHQMQQLAIALVEPPEEVRALARDYIDQLCDQFQLPRANSLHRGRPKPVYEIDC